MKTQLFVEYVNFQMIHGFFVFFLENALLLTKGVFGIGQKKKYSHTENCQYFSSPGPRSLAQKTLLSCSLTVRETQHHTMRH